MDGYTEASTVDTLCNWVKCLNLILKNQIKEYCDGAALPNTLNSTFTQCLFHTNEYKPIQMQISSYTRIIMHEVCFIL